jgi:hypothetical protein
MRSFHGNFWFVPDETIMHPKGKVDYQILLEAKHELQEKGFYTKLFTINEKDTFFTFIHRTKQHGYFLWTREHGRRYTSYTVFRVRRPDFEYFWRVTRRYEGFSSGLLQNPENQVQRMLMHAARNVKEVHAMNTDITAVNFPERAVQIFNMPYEATKMEVQAMISRFMENTKSRLEANYVFLEHKEIEDVKVMPWTEARFGRTSLFVFFSASYMLIRSSDSRTAQEAIRQKAWPTEESDGRRRAIQGNAVAQVSPWRITISGLGTRHTHTHEKKTHLPASSEMNDRT